MSTVFFALLLALTIAQAVFWRYLGETFDYAASVSMFGLSASLTFILGVRVAFLSGRGKSPAN